MMRFPAIVALAASGYGPDASGSVQTQRNPIDDYLAQVEPSKRKALERIRKLAIQVVPEAVETIMYGMPTLKYRGKPFLGYAARANFIGLYPYSARVIETCAEKLAMYETSKGAIRVPLDAPIPQRLLRALIDCRIHAICADAK